MANDQQDTTPTATTSFKTQQSRSPNSSALVRFEATAKMLFAEIDNMTLSGTVINKRYMDKVNDIIRVGKRTNEDFKRWDKILKSYGVQSENSTGPDTKDVEEAIDSFGSTSSDSSVGETPTRKKPKHSPFTEALKKYNIARAKVGFTVSRMCEVRGTAEYFSERLKKLNDIQNDILKEFAERLVDLNDYIQKHGTNNGDELIQRLLDLQRSWGPGSAE